MTLICPLSLLRLSYQKKTDPGEDEGYRQLRQNVCPVLEIRDIHDAFSEIDADRCGSAAGAGARRPPETVRCNHWLGSMMCVFEDHLPVAVHYEGGPNCDSMIVRTCAKFAGTTGQAADRSTA